MCDNLTMEGKRARSISLSLRESFILGLCGLMLAGVFLAGSPRAPIASSETRFVEYSESGLQIVPASCPSSPHYSGHCSQSIPCSYSFADASNSCLCPTGYTPSGSVCIPPGDPGTPGYSQGSYNQGYSQSSYYAQSSYYSQGSYCSATYFCSGSNLHYRNAQCGESFVQACAWGCSGSGCLPPPPPEGNITASPSIVRRGETSAISWTTKNVTSCTVTENNVEINDSWTGNTGTNKPTGVLTQQTVYTLRCTGVDGSTFVDAVTVNIIPVFEEQ